MVPWEQLIISRPVISRVFERAVSGLAALNVDAPHKESPLVLIEKGKYVN